MKQLKVQRNRFTWLNLISLLLLIAGGTFAGFTISLFLFRYVLIIGFLIFWVYDFILDKHYFIYDSLGIIKLKIGNIRRENIWFVDMLDVKISQSQFSFNHRIKRRFRKEKRKHYTFDLTNFNQEEAIKLKAVLLEYCETASPEIQTVEQPTRTRVSNRTPTIQS